MGINVKLASIATMVNVNKKKLHTPFPFSFPYKSPDLGESIGRMGQIMPILVSRINSRISIVDGYKRYLILQDMDLEPAIYELPPMDLKEGFLIYLEINSHIRRLNSVEKILISRFITTYKVDLPDVLRQRLGLGDIEKNSNLKEFIEEISENSRLTIAQKCLDINSIYRLYRLGKGFAETILSLIDKFNLTHQESRQLIQDLFFLSMKEGDISELLSSINSLNYNDIKKEIRALLNPELTELERRFDEFIKRYKNLKITPPPSFEGDTYKIESNFSGPEDIERIIDELERLYKEWEQNLIS